MDSDAESKVVRHIQHVADELGSPLFTSDPSKTWRIRTLTILLIATTIGCFLTIVTEWHNLNLRFQAIEDFVVLLFASTLSLELWLSPQNLQIKLMAMEGKEYRVWQRGWREQELLKERQLRGQVHIGRLFIIIVIMFSFINAILPMVFTIVFVQRDQVIKKENLFMAFECWLPFTVDSFSKYMAVAVVHLISMTYFSACSYCWFTSTVGSLLAVCSYMDSLCISIKKITDANLPNDNQSLRAHFVQLIRHHQAVIRSAKLLNESLNVSMLFFNQVCCVQFCLSLYGFFEQEERSSKLKYLLLIIPVFWCFILFCSYGQQLINKSEMVWLSFAECHWIDKPNWFKKNMSIILRRAHHQSQITPLRLYILNFKNITAVLQAAYSYFNLMHTLNRKEY